MMPWYPKAILSVAAVLSFGLASVRRFRQWAFRVDLRWLVAFHFIRFAGIYFLYLYTQGELPYGFAVFGGSGDIIVAASAVVLMFFTGSAPVLFCWNVLGLGDIIAVAVMAARSEMASAGSMRQLDRLPLILLPTLVVPAIVVTHGLMLVRILSPRAGLHDRYSRVTRA